VAAGRWAEATRNKVGHDNASKRKRRRERKPNDHARNEGKERQFKSSLWGTDPNKQPAGRSNANSKLEHDDGASEGGKGARATPKQAAVDCYYKSEPDRRGIRTVGRSVGRSNARRRRRQSHRRRVAVGDDATRRTKKHRKHARERAAEPRAPNAGVDPGSR